MCLTRKVTKNVALNVYEFARSYHNNMNNIYRKFFLYFFIKYVFEVGLRFGNICIVTMYVLAIRIYLDEKKNKFSIQFVIFI